MADEVADVRGRGAGGSGDETNEQSLNIARRTRSHVRVDDFVLNDNLDFPDADRSLYQDPNSEGDTEFKNFLNGCYSTTADIGGDTNTDDNDPEYVYNDDIFSHGWRFDLDEELQQNDFEEQRVSMEELELQQQSIPPIDPSINKTTTVQFPSSDTQLLSEHAATATRVAVLAAPKTTEFKSPSKYHRRRIDMFDDPEFARILNQQLRQHIQLLTQTYLLTKNTTNMHNEADEAKAHLNSYMKVFKNKSKPSNLMPAMELVNNLATPKDIKSSIRLSWRPLPIPGSVRTTINNNPNIFMYPSLLPQVAFSILPEKLVPKKPKINFTSNEDKLLAYALHEFKGESSQYAFIASLLMTTKTKTQISNHIKNIKRSSGNENNPIKLYHSRGVLPRIDLDSDAEFYRVPYKDQDEMMNMDLDDLMAASITISKSAASTTTNSNNCNGSSSSSGNNNNTTTSNNSNNNNNSENSRNIKNLMLKKSMLNLMSHKFLLSQDMGDLIICEFLRRAETTLSERNYLHLLQLLTDLMKTDTKKGKDDNSCAVVVVYEEISRFLSRIGAPPELHERVVLFLDLDQATKCGCALSYLHWMRFFEFMQHVELYHDGEGFEKKLTRFIDALQRDDSNKVRLATANLVNKHPLLKREFESLSLDGKPHPSLFICEEDFDDISEPMYMLDGGDSTIKPSASNETTNYFIYEHFNSKVTTEESNYASQSCPCQCHTVIKTTLPPTQSHVVNQLGQHCGKCNLKFMRGRMYLVNKIKPILAEWSYIDTPQPAPQLPPPPQSTSPSPPKSIEWTFEEDKEILEFCRAKAEQNDESISFDASTFEEFVNKRKECDPEQPSSIPTCKKSALEIADRFNQLMGMFFSL